MKILYRPQVALISKPIMDWSAYSAFMNENYNVTAEYGLALDEESSAHFGTHPADAIPMVCAKSCYKAWETGRKNIKEYLDNIKKEGHGSVFEHANFGFVAITSRAITHEIIRHRAGFAYSQESQRYCEERNNAFIMPLSVQGSHEAKKSWADAMTIALDHYVNLVEELTATYSTMPEYAGWSKTELRKKVREAARGVLPNDTASIIHMTANVRSWRHFIEMRGSSHAEAGIRLLANAIYEKLLQAAPVLFSDYMTRPLTDGTFEISTAYPKI